MYVEGDRRSSCKFCYFHPKWIWYRFVRMFYKTSLSVLEMMYVDTRGNINSINAVKFHCEAPQIKCRSKCKCCWVATRQTALSLKEGENSKLNWKILDNKEHGFKLKRSLYKPGQLLGFRGGRGSQISGLSACEVVKVFTLTHRPHLPTRKYS
jgi:hypothetical protein